MYSQTIETTSSSPDSVTMFTYVHKLSKQNCHKTVPLCSHVSTNHQNKTVLPGQCKYNHMYSQTIETTPSSSDSGTMLCSNVSTNYQNKSFSLVSVNINTCVHKPSKQHRPQKTVLLLIYVSTNHQNKPVHLVSANIRTCVHKPSKQHRHQKTVVLLTHVSTNYQYKTVIT